MEGEAVFLAVKKQCRIRGVFLSPKKEIVARYLSTHENYINAEEIWNRIRADRERCSITTVYQALRWFEMHKIVNMVNDRSQKKRYVLSDEIMLSSREFAFVCSE